ncbi:hypothetical protein [Acetobacter orleanensis]|uniref:hypothetical protein n=1 Tax=Acetobacter orleanensis TaxID=104099 RepID=UPI000AE5AE14|nr:hypothetical protein [Acetobacter orleanensis]
MVRAAIEWTHAMDTKLRHFERCGLCVRRQARRLGVSERSIYTRRKQLRLDSQKSKKI